MSWFIKLSKLGIYWWSLFQFVSSTVNLNSIQLELVENSKHRIHRLCKRPTSLPTHHYSFLLPLSIFSHPYLLLVPQSSDAFSILIFLGSKNFVSLSFLDFYSFLNRTLGEKLFHWMSWFLEISSLFPFCNSILIYSKIIIIISPLDHLPSLSHQGSPRNPHYQLNDPAIFKPCPVMCTINHWTCVRIQTSDHILLHTVWANLIYYSKGRCFCLLRGFYSPHVFSHSSVRFRKSNRSHVYGVADWTNRPTFQMRFLLFLSLSLSECWDFIMKFQIWIEWEVGNQAHLHLFYLNIDLLYTPNL